MIQTERNSLNKNSFTLNDFRFTENDPWNNILDSIPSNKNCNFSFIKNKH